MDGIDHCLWADTMSLSGCIVSRSCCPQGHLYSAAGGTTSQLDPWTHHPAAELQTLAVGLTPCVHQNKTADLAVGMVLGILGAAGTEAFLHRRGECSQRFIRVKLQASPSARCSVLWLCGHL